MFNILKKLDPLVHLVLFLVIGVLFALLYSLRGEINELKSKLTNQGSVQRVNPIVKEVTQEEILTPEQIRELVSQLISTPSASPAVIIQKDEGEMATTFIPLGTTGTTVSQDWVNVEDALVFIDVKNDYGDSAYIEWEASLKVAHGNGQAFVRLWDDTNKIAVNGSELSTSGNASFQQVRSGRLIFWSGRNLYKVQIKSLNGFEVTYSAGRIKVSY